MRPRRRRQHQCTRTRSCYGDHRRISGDPIEDATRCERQSQRVFEQYTQFEFRVLAVRVRLAPGLGPMVNDVRHRDRRIVRSRDRRGRANRLRLRFDEDDFDGAYRELDRRYYAGEGAAFADRGAAATESIIALNHRRFRSAARRAQHPRHARREPNQVSVPGSLDHRLARQLRRAELDGHVDANLAVFGVLGIAGVVRRPSSSATPSGTAANCTSWTRVAGESGSATGGWRLCASSSSTTRRRRSPTPRSERGDRRAELLSPIQAFSLPTDSAQR